MHPAVFHASHPSGDQTRIARWFDGLGRSIKAIWLFLWAATATLLVVGPILIASLGGGTGNQAFRLCRFWSQLFFTACRVRVRCRGKANVVFGRKYVIVSNHQSHLDAPALIIALNIQYRTVVKEELGRIPVFGLALRKSRNIFIDRRDHESAMASIRNGVKRLPPGVGIMFFPEGTRSPDGRLRQFKLGAFKVAIEQRLPVLPVAINGTRRLMPKGSLDFRPGTVEVVVAPPIEPDHPAFSDAETLARAAHAAVAANRGSDEC